jgi:LDH2 family malate/lactate/ureidoglycolate dehydrogenase
MTTRSAASLRELARNILSAVGTPQASAWLVADSLVDANLAGHDSHGVLRLPGYIQAARSGHVDPSRLPALLSRQRATAIVDAATGWGQPAMWLATENVIELAAEYGIAAAVVRNSFHIGRVAPYVEAIARAGMIGLATANAAPAVAPYGGRSRVFGTNPIAWAAPRAGGREPVCLDVATAAVAEGKLRVARAKGVPAPDGCIVDRDGHPTCDPAGFYDGGALLPFGAHKGSGFSLLAQILGWGLAGMNPSAYDGPRGVNGPFVLAINVASFTPLAEFVDAVEAQCATVAASPPAEGFSEVLVPGEPELRAREKRLREGIQIPEPTWNELLTVASDLGVEVTDR